MSTTSGPRRATRENDARGVAATHGGAIARLTMKEPEGT